MRDSWDRYFLRIAREVATRATCDRKHVGAVLVQDRRIVATGYNGSIPGAAHCDEAGHLLEGAPPKGGEDRRHCVRTVHAEANAVAQAATHGASTAGATCYVTAAPCWICFRLLAAAGVRRIVYAEAYRLDPQVLSHAEATGIELVQIALDTPEAVA